MPILGRRRSRTALLLTLLALSACDAKSPDSSWEQASKGSYSAALSPDSRYSLIGSINHGGSLWEIERNQRLFNWNHQTDQVSTIIACAFSPEGNFAITADHQTLVLWDSKSGQALSFWTAPSEVLSVALSPEGRYALLGLGDHSAVLFDVRRGGIKRSFYHQDRVLSVALSADGKLALSGSQDQTAKLWDIESGKLLHSWTHQDDVITVALAANGKQALSVAKYDRAAVWDTSSGRKRGELALGANAIKRGQAFSSAAFSADGSQLLTGSSDREVQLWSTRDFSSLAQWTVPKRDPWKPTSASILAVGFGSKPGNYYAIASNGFTHRLSR